MAQPGSEILARQNTPSMLHLLCAVTASHVRAQRLEGLRLGVSALIALLGVPATVIGSLATPVTVIGGLWALVHSIGLSAWAQREVSRAALLQEMFDTRLLRLPWNTVLAGQALGPDEISKLARRFRGEIESLHDYYEVPDLPRPFDVLACQVQNLGWGARIRLRYALAILMAVAVWTGGGVVLGALMEVSVADLVMLFYVPSLGALMMGLETYRAQRQTAEIRSGTLGIVRARIVDAVTSPELADGLVPLARQVQDVIFQTRQSSARVPNIFFDRYRRNDRVDFQASMAEMVQLVTRR